VLVSSCSEKGNKLDALRAEGFEGSQQVAHRSSEAVKLPDDDGIKAAPVCVSHKAVELGTVFLSAADSPVNVLAATVQPRRSA
jgi:hypothetical protein